MLAEVAQIYRTSKKKVDINLWTEYVCRPPAAVLVYLLKNTRVTPNQITFLSFVVACGAGAMLALLPGHLWLIASVVVYELSFVLDCVDGQLARLRKTSSTVGHLLDFLMDEIKALVILGCVTIRLFRETGDELYFYCGLGGIVALATGLMLTTFIRRPEYGEAKPPGPEGQPVQRKSRAGIGRVIGLVEHAARTVVHYPSYIWLVAAFNRIDIYFWAYIGVNVLYAGMTFLAILIKLGKPAPRKERGTP